MHPPVLYPSAMDKVLPLIVKLREQGCGLGFSSPSVITNVWSSPVTLPSTPPLPGKGPPGTALPAAEIEKALAPVAQPLAIDALVGLGGHAGLLVRIPLPPSVGEVS